MSLKIKTPVIQEMVSKAIKGASNNKMIPITSLMALNFKDGKLTITTTDATNTLKISKKDIEGEEDFYVAVPVDIFSKLIAKTTTEHITLDLSENTLTIKGNGTYSLELPLDEDGRLIKFPDYKFDTSVEKVTINLSTIKQILATNKAALADTMEIPCLTGYYCNDNEVITTDTFKVCGNKIGLFSEPALISAELMNLLAVIEDEKISVQRSNGKLLFTTNEVVIYGAELEGIEDYPVDAIHAYLETDFASKCSLPKQAFLNVLDRLSLFIASYDKNGLYMTFTKDGVIVSSKRSNGSELIKYQASENFQPFTYCIDIELLRSQISAQTDEVIQLWYGHNKAIKMTSGNITQIVALLEDERTTESME